MRVWGGRDTLQGRDGGSLARGGGGGGSVREGEGRGVVLTVNLR